MNVDPSKAVSNGTVASSSSSNSHRTCLANGGSPERSYNSLSNDFSFPSGGIPSLRLPVVVVLNPLYWYNFWKVFPLHFYISLFVIVYVVCSWLSLCVMLFGMFEPHVVWPWNSFYRWPATRLVWLPDVEGCMLMLMIIISIPFQIIGMLFSGDTLPFVLMYINSSCFFAWLKLRGLGT